LYRDDPKLDYILNH